MSIGVSVFLIAVGAILTFALERDAEGINLDTVGIILMIVGALGLVISTLFWSSWGPYGPNGTRRRRVVDVDERVRGQGPAPAAAPSAEPVAGEAGTEPRT